MLIKETKMIPLHCKLSYKNNESYDCTVFDVAKTLDKEKFGILLGDERTISCILLRLSNQQITA